MNENTKNNIVNFVSPFSVIFPHVIPLYSLKYRQKLYIIYLVKLSYGF